MFLSGITIFKTKSSVIPKHTSQIIIIMNLRKIYATKIESQHESLNVYNSSEV